MKSKPPLPTPWATPWIPHSQIADVIDVSGSFNWWGYVGSTQPNDEAAGTGGEAGKATVNDGFPTEVNNILYPNGRPNLEAEPGRIDLGPEVRKVVRTYDEQTFELYEPVPQPCLLARIAKERRRIRYERCVDLREVSDDEIKEWNDKVGLPQEPIYVKTYGKPKPAPDGADNNVLVEMWIESAEQFDASEAQEVERMLRMHFRGATREEVLEAGERWAYQLLVDPSTLNKTQQKSTQRKTNDMRKQSEGHCPTSVCPTNQCANFELSYAERQEIHRVNTAKFDSIANLGRWFCWVKLNGQWYPKFLPLPLGETRPRIVQAALRKLVRSEVRRAGTRAAKAERRAAFNAVEGLHFMEVVWDEDAAKTYVWDRLAKRVKVVDDATGEVHDFEGGLPRTNAAD